MYARWFMLSLVSLALGLALLIGAIASNKPQDSPKLGSRGLARKITMEEGGLFTLTEPFVRFLAGWLAYLSLGNLRTDIDRLTRHAGDWLGVTANEFLGLAVIGGFSGACAGAVLATQLDTSVFVVTTLFGAFGFAAPWLQAQSIRDARFKQCARTLPAAIDLASLCMGAGLDFPGSLKQIVEKAGRPGDPLIQELGKILQELDLGRTRKQALENFAERVPHESVRDFVSSVVQAEEKGNPLADVLQIQATMLRMRRSVVAEEAASKAAVAMIAPLMLIFLCILLVLMGPFILTARNL